MKLRQLLVLLLVALAGSAAVALRTQQRTDAGGVLPALPDRPEPVFELLEARPFTLERAEIHHSRLEAPSYDAGFLVALRVPADRATVREGYEPVLCAGLQTLARRNLGGPESVVVAILPTPRGAAGEPLLEWSETPFWYAAPELPERVDRAWLELELERAMAEGISAFPPEEVEAALTGELLQLAGGGQLDALLAELIERHSPGEVDLVRGLRVTPQGR